MAAIIDPTPSEIAERAAEIRSEWSEVTEMRRRGLRVDDNGNLNTRHDVVVYRKPNVRTHVLASD